jgi:putative acetyltransferase
MIKDLAIRPAGPADRDGIRAIETEAFGQPGEAALVDALVAAGDVVLELVATQGSRIVGHVLFSRLLVERDGGAAVAVALAPIAVRPQQQKERVGSALIESAHSRLKEAGETLSIVLGDPAYYGRFGYTHARAAGFASDYQCEALQALCWGDAPTSGRLVYAPAFSGL